MKTQYLIPIIGFVLFIGIMFKVKTTFMVIEDEVKEYESELSSYLGDTVVINKDTLTVVNYSIFNETLILSNSVEISPKLISK
jgi:hypothetical protein